MCKIFLLIFVVLGLIGLAILFYIFSALVFVGKVTEVKVKLDTQNKILAAGVTLEELIIKQDPLQYEYSPKAGNLPIARDVLLNQDLTFTEGSAHFDNEVVRQYLLLETKNYSFAFKGNKLYSVVKQKLGEQQLAWDSSGLKSVRHAAYISRDLMLIIADDAAFDYVKSNIYLVNPHTLVKKIIASDPYFSFVRPPKVIKLDNFDSIVFIYYTGSYSYAYGGDSSRPKKSTVRIFNKKHSMGIDVVELPFSSGTIVDVRFENNTLILTGDPSRPSQSGKDRLPPRFWRINVAELL